MRMWLLVFAAACGAPRPPAAAPSPPLALAAPLSRLQFYVGDWACDGAELHDDQPPKHQALTVRVRPELGGAWLSIAVFVDGAQVTSELKGYDTDAKHYRHLAVASDGAVTFTSGGW